jgi:sulfate transport system ATP-binding protein
MGFVGEVNRIDGRLVRPHDVEILPVRAEGTVEADIDRIVELGFSGRVEMVLTDGEEVWAQLTRSELESLGLEDGQRVHIRPRPGAVTREDNGAIDQTISDQAPAASHRPTPAGSGLPV